MSIKTLHFDLHFNSKEDFSSEPKLSIRGRKYDIKPHTDKTLIEAIHNNESLELVVKNNPNSITHYCDIPIAHLPDDRLSMLIVEGTVNEEMPEVRPDIYMLSYYIPDAHIQDYFISKARELESIHKLGSQEHLEGLQSLMHPKFHYYGFETHTFPVESAEHMVKLNTQNNVHITPMDVAVSLLFKHPQLSTNKVKIATKIKLDHILQVSNPNKTQYTLLSQLATQIAKLGKPTKTNGWASTKEATDVNGNPVKAEYTLTAKDGKDVFTKGQQFYQFELNKKLDIYIGTPAVKSINSTRRDPSLQNKQWSINQGKGAISKDVMPKAGTDLQEFAVVNMDASSNGGFTFTNKSPGYGLGIDTTSIKYEPGSTNEFGTFSVNVTNSFLRQLGVYVEFFKDEEMKQPIKNPSAGTQEWKSYFTKALEKDFETDTMKGVGSVPNVNTIMGIPLDASPTTITFNWPEEAQAARLMFGGIGSSNSIKPVIWPGVIMTSIFQFALPTFFLVAGTALTSTSWFTKFVGKKALKLIIFQLAVPIVQALVNIGISGNPGRVMASFGQAFLSMMGKVEFAALAVPIAAKIAAGEAEDNIPVIGMAFRIANIALTAIGLAETAIEVAISPAVIETGIKRQMALDFTLHPDPAHGEPDDSSTAIWPLVGDHVETVITYKNGTTFKQTQNLPKTSSNAPLKFVFEDIGWGGVLQIVSNVYSKNGWLCGQYKSPDIEAIPDNQTQAPYVLTKSDNIKEFLVPLTQDTQYQYHQKLTYNKTTQQHEWEVGSVPVATKNDLSCSSAGNHLCKPVNITINDKAFQIGYAYQASNQGIPIEGTTAPTDSQMYVFQNISALADSTLNKRLKQSKVGFNVQPYILYDKFGEGPSKTEISPYNFIIDSRNGAYYLRQVDLTDGTHDFGLTGSNLKAYGKFTIPHLDAIVYHNSGYVIAASFMDSAVQALKIDLKKGPVSDDKAPTAGILSGPGISQGLTLGPVSMKVTPDGRILLLETLNRRVQAFDVFGNPVPSFKGKVKFSVASASFSPDLDKKVFSDALQQKFDQNELTSLFEFPSTSTLLTSLDSQTLTMDLIEAFASAFITLTYKTKEDGSIDPNGSTYITKLTDGKLWTVTDPNKKFVYTLEKDSNVIKVFDVLTHVEIQVISEGKKWVANDLEGARSYLLEVDTIDTTKINVMDYRSYFWLGERSKTVAPPSWLQKLLDNRFTEPIGSFIYYNLDSNISQAQANKIIADALANPLNPSNLPYVSDITYLDIAVESKGYTYVLYFKNDGTNYKDYFIDIYDPSGNYLVTTPDSRLYSSPASMQYVCTSKLAIDAFRNMFTLNYEAFAGEVMQTGHLGRTEPSISTWVPTPPMFSLPISDLAIFQSLDMVKINRLLTAHNLILSQKATIKPIDPKDSNGKYSHFLITDGDKQYDIIVSLTYKDSIKKDPANATQKVFVYNILA